MATQFATTTDGFQIAYDVQGTGPTLLLAHGFSNDRTLWQQHGWVEQLQQEYTVITVDLRGCGESTATTEPADYTHTAHLTDIEAILDACAVEQSLYWGWSLGGTIGLHLAAQTDRIQRAIIAGTYFELNLRQGHWHDDNIEIARIAKAKREGTLDALNLDEDRRRFAESMDLDRFWARRYAMESWPAMQPAELRCPTLVYSGTNDGQIVEILRQQRAEIEEAGQTLHIFEGFDHLQLVSERAVITPIVRSFLQA